MQLFFILFLSSRMPPALCIHILCKKSISLMKVDEYVICDKCQIRHYREKEQNTPQAVNCTESCKWNDYTTQTSKPKRDNNISSPSCVRLSISSTSKTHSIAFYARNLILSLSKFNLKQDFLHFFTKKL